MHQAGVRFDPLGFPLVAANVFEDSDTLNRTARHTLLAKGVFSAGFDLGFLHPALAET